MAASSSATARPSSSNRQLLPPPPKKVETEYKHLIAAREMLSDPTADPNGCSGLAAVLHDSMNDVLPLDESQACV